MRLIRWLLRSSFYFIFLLPLLGWLAIYLFVALTILTLGTFDIWPTDPKNTPLGEAVYDAAGTFAVFGLLFCIPVLIYIVIDFILRRYNFIDNHHLLPVWVRIASFTGSLLLLVFYYFDIGYYQFWFFD